MRQWLTLGVIATVLVIAGLAFAPAALAQTSSGNPAGPTTTPAAPPSHGTEIDMPIGHPAEGFEDAPPEEPTEDNPPKFYDEDIPTKTESIIYVIDQSGSMGWGNATYTGLDGHTTSGTPLDRAKCELMRSISGLTSEFEFNIISYDCDLRKWSAGKQKAEPGPKASAMSWVGALRDLGATGTGPAVVMALQDKTNFTVVLLSDGAPNCPYSSISQHLNAIQAANTQHAVIHTFGIGCYGQFEQFMRDVASTSGGRYYPIP